MDSGSVTPKLSCNRASRYQGSPAPYLARASETSQVSSYFSGITPAGSGAVKRSCDAEDVESDSLSAPVAGDGFVLMRVSDRGPNSSRLRQEGEAFFCRRDTERKAGSGMRMSERMIAMSTTPDSDVLPRFLVQRETSSGTYLWVLTTIHARRIYYMRHT